MTNIIEIFDNENIQSWELSEEEMSECVNVFYSETTTKKQRINFTKFVSRTGNHPNFLLSWVKITENISKKEMISYRNLPVDEKDRFFERRIELCKFYVNLTKQKLINHINKNNL